MGGVGGYPDPHLLYASGLPLPPPSSSSWIPALSVHLASDGGWSSSPRACGGGRGAVRPPLVLLMCLTIGPASSPFRPPLSEIWISTTWTGTGGEGKVGGFTVEHADVSKQKILREAGLPSEVRVGHAQKGVESPARLFSPSLILI